MKKFSRLMILAGISGWILLAVAAIAAFLLRDEIRASRYWALDRAVYSGDTATVKMLLFFGADATGLRDYQIFLKNGGGHEFSAPLGQAAWTSRIEIARLLLEAGADPNVLEGEGYAPLDIAAEQGHKDLVILLLEHGANPAKRAPLQASAAEIARKNGWPEIAKLIEEWKKANPPK